MSNTIDHLIEDYVIVSLQCNCEHVASMVWGEGASKYRELSSSEKAAVFSGFLKSPPSHKMLVMELSVHLLESSEKTIDVEGKLTYAEPLVATLQGCLDSDKEVAVWGICCLHHFWDNDPSRYPEYFPLFSVENVRNLIRQLIERCQGRTDVDEVKLRRVIEVGKKILARDLTQWKAAYEAGHEDEEDDEESTVSATA